VTPHAPGKVLITGAGGFVGRHLVADQRARGRHVRAIDVRMDGLEALKADGDLVLEAVDVRSTDRLRPHLAACDTVFHLAAAHLDVLKDDDYFHDVNVRATAALVAAAAEEGVRRFVHCSTVGVYGPLASLPADEETTPAPDIAYEESKLAGERAVREAAAGTAVDLAIIRPSWVYGPHCPRTYKLIRTVARKRFFFVGDGANLRHPLYVTDLLEAFELAATKPLPAVQPIIVAGPDTVTIRQLIDLILDELGMSYRPPRVPLGLMSVACFAIEQAARLSGREPQVSRRSLKFFTDSSAFDTARARHQLDFRPRIDTRHGLRATIEYYRQHGLLPPATSKQQATRMRNH
jgi:nucleoside-diphosphate-sugar epimerase